MNYGVGIKSPIFPLRSNNKSEGFPTTKFLSTPDSSGKPLSEAKSLERIAGKGSEKITSRNAQSPEELHRLMRSRRRGKGFAWLRSGLSR